MAEPFDNFADDKAVMGIGLKNCDAHDDDAGEAANDDFSQAIEGTAEGLMKLHKTALNARILQSRATLLDRTTLNFARHTVTNSFNMSREVIACANTWPNRTVSTRPRPDARKQHPLPRKVLYAYFTTHGNVGRFTSLSSSS